jgi:D-glycero-alpha-D-manno-heptose 1-phosphate guanylyltransferase
MDQIANIDAIVLAGGRGTRLSSAVSDRPKVLADVGGRPFIAYLLDLLQGAGVRRAVLSVGYMADLVEDCIGTRHGLMEIAYSREEQPLGTGGGVQLATRLVRSDPVIALNGDSYCHLDVPSLVRFHGERGSHGTLSLFHVSDTSRYGRVKLDDAQRVIGFQEKMTGGGAGHINAGIYVLSQALLQSIPAGRAVSLEHDVFPGWVGRGLYGFECPGPFLDIGTPLSYSQAEAFFASQRH